MWPTLRVVSASTHQLNRNPCYPPALLRLGTRTLGALDVWMFRVLLYRSAYVCGMVCRCVIVRSADRGKVLAVGVRVEGAYPVSHHPVFLACLGLAFVLLDLIYVNTLNLLHSFTPTTLTAV